MKIIAAAVLGFLFMVVLLFAALPRILAVNATPSESGSVVAYGHVIAPPYTFSGIDADTLLLNGYPFLPLRTDEPPPITTELSSSALQNFELSNQVQEDLRLKVDEIRRAMNDSGPDLNAAIADVYRQSPYVEDVRVEHGQILVKFIFHEGYIGQFFMPLDYKPGKPRPIEEVRKDKIESFWSQVNSGGMYLFGSTYRHYVPSHLAPDVLRIIEEFKGHPTPVTANQEAYVRDVLDDINEEAGLEQPKQ